MTPRNNKKTFMGNIAVFCIKQISNWFWEIADNWSYTNEKIAEFYNKGIGMEYQKEYATCCISANANVLHIGCGAYPLTEIVLSQCTTGHVVGIDKNQKTVKRAQRLIQKKHLENHITINYGDGLNYPVDSFDAIIVSSCSLPKVKILQHLFLKAKPNSSIIVREVDIATDGIQQCIADHPDIESLQKIHHNPFPFFEPFGWTTFCLRKK
jgi:2-polyprenyl-3-methyl-5-hydroxy-6-metoxy-1,4-benzoquinol methylase